MEPVLEERIKQLEDSLKAMERALLAVSNTLRVVDAAAFLALYNLEHYPRLPRKENLDKEMNNISPSIQKMLELLISKEQDEEKKPDAD